MIAQQGWMIMGHDGQQHQGYLQTVQGFDWSLKLMSKQRALEVPIPGRGGDLPGIMPFNPQK